MSGEPIEAVITGIMRLSLEEKMSDTKESFKVVGSPRVGGVIDNVPWTGGSNLAGKGNEAPDDILCYRPSGFKEMQKQHESLKQGLETEQK